MQRTRLFERLDPLENGGFAWVAAPAGAGKTSLVASWLDRRRRNDLWYRIDAADRDPATLFHYLALAVSSSGRARAHDLPHLTPEYLAGLPDFSRRFFRAMFARMQSPPLLVFDNCHEATGSPLDGIIACALDEMPRGGALICIGRNDPGPPFALRAADHRFIRIDAEALRFDRDEARAIADVAGFDAHRVEALCEQAQGWAAGLVLMMRADDGGDGTSGRSGPLHASAAAQRGVFDYFTALILSHAGGRLKSFLLRTSVLPIVSPSQATRLTGEAHAAEFLADLHARHFFTERRTRFGEDPAYEYHPLFREYLLECARSEMGAEAFAGHCRSAAELLLESGNAERAAELRIPARDWAGLLAAIRQQAPELMRQGRWQTLQGWIDAVPAEVLECDAWALYWRGTCKCLVDPAGAIPDLEAAYRQFHAANDPLGMLLACAGALEAGYLELGDQRPSRSWIVELDRLLAATPTLPIAIEIRVIQALMGAWMAAPQHPMLAGWASRAAELVRALPHTAGSAGLIAFASCFYMWAGDFAAARDVLDAVQLDRRIIESEPLVAIMVHVSHCVLAWQSAEHEHAYELAAAAFQVADASGVHVIDGLVVAQLLYAATSSGDLPRAQDGLRRLRGLLIPRRRLEVCQAGVFAANVALLEGRSADALALVERALHEFDSMGAPFMIATTQVQCAELLVLEGREDESHPLLDAALEFACTMPSAILQFQVALVRAWARLRSGERTQALAALASGLAIGRERGYLNMHPMWIPDMAREVFATALVEGIETDYVRRFIRHRRLTPGPREVSGWPWPIEIHCLGTFEIRRDGAALQPARKAPQRVLELLKALVAFGPSGADADELAAMLWPQADGDAGRQALSVTVHRLRRLLGFEQSILAVEGRIALDPDWCWVDAFAFERIADTGATAPDHPVRLLELYRGPFLAQSERAWMLPARERLRSKFLRRLEACAVASMDAGRLDEATDLFRRGIESDPLAESLYRGLARCLARQGRIAEALDVYRRCREMLSVVLGVRPAAQTQALHDELLALQSLAAADAGGPARPPRRIDE